MNRAELIAQTRAALKTAGHHVTNTLMDDTFSAMCGVMAAELLGGGDVSLSGVGKLKVKNVPAHPGRNPKTGEVLEISARRKVVFVAGGNMREALKQ